MSKRWPLRIAMGLAGAVVASWMLLCHYVVDQGLVCGACAATGSEKQWLLGVMPLGYPLFHDSSSIHGPWAVAISAGHLDVTPSLATTLLFGPDHVHEWRGTGASPSYLFGQRWGGCAVGPPRRSSPFAATYLQDSDFRAFVERLIVSETYDRPTMAAYFAAEESSVTSEAHIRGSAVVAEFRQRDRSSTKQ